MIGIASCTGHHTSSRNFAGIARK
jgi:hypothetical protein